MKSNIMKSEKQPIEIKIENMTKKYLFVGMVLHVLVIPIFIYFGDLQFGDFEWNKWSDINGWFISFEYNYRFLIYLGYALAIDHGVKWLWSKEMESKYLPKKPKS